MTAILNKFAEMFL